MKFENTTVSNDSFEGSIHVRAEAPDNPNGFTTYAVFDDIEQVSTGYTGRNGKRLAREFARGYAHSKARYNDD